MAEQFEEGFATDPWYIHLYRTGHAYHGVHPFYMWYWCAHALAAPRARRYRGRRPAGRPPARVPPASTLADALEMAQDVVGRDPTITHLRVPPSLDGGGHVTRRVHGAATPGKELRPTVRRGNADEARGAGRTLAKAQARRRLRHRLGAALPDPSRARAVVLDDITRPIARVMVLTSVIGLDHLDPLEGPMILAANHASRLDTGLLLSSLPVKLRHHTIVAAAADYFFDRHWKAAFWSFGLGAIPMERSKVNRRSTDLAADLIKDGWSLIIFPEGGRTADGWGREFKGGASYLAKRCGVPVIPVHIRGTRAVLAKSSSRLRPGTTEIRIGDALIATTMRTHASSQVV